LNRRETYNNNVTLSPPEMTAPTIFVIDDQPSVRDAIGEMLSVFGFSVETFDSAVSFLDTVKTTRAGCVVADVRMPGTDGIALVGEMAKRGIAIPVILISGHADVPMAVAGIKAGAEDFIEKPIDDAKLVAAINRALARVFAAQDSAKQQDELSERFARLTPRQVEIFDLVAGGFTSQAIAGRLDLSTRTVESYRAQIMEKMLAESVAVLVRQAIRLGRIKP
jgi:two-component system response regulator FixJ